MERIDWSHKFLEIKQILSYKIVFLEHCIIISEKLLSYKSINPIEVFRNIQAYLSYSKKNISTLNRFLALTFI